MATNTTNITNLTDSVGDLKDDALLWNGTAFSAAHGTDATSKITNVKSSSCCENLRDSRTTFVVQCFNFQLDPDF
nr:hypothetical protein [Escherichia coli]